MRPRPVPERALSATEREAVLAELRSERFVDSSPAQVWATLLDEGRYLASERTMYRLLEASGEVGERRDQLTHPPYERPELLAERPNEVWSWDITKLKGPALVRCSTRRAASNGRPAHHDRPARPMSRWARCTRRSSPWPTPF